MRTVSHRDPGVNPIVTGPIDGQGAQAVQLGEYEKKRLEATSAARVFPCCSHWPPCAFTPLVPFPMLLNHAVIGREKIWRATKPGKPIWMDGGGLVPREITWIFRTRGMRPGRGQLGSPLGSNDQCRWLSRASRRWVVNQLNGYPAIPRLCAALRGR